MDHVPLETRNAFCTDLCAAQTKARSRLVSSGILRQNHNWVTWQHYTQAIGIDPILSKLDPNHAISILQVFAERVRDGRLSLSKKPVKSSTVGAALRDVGQAHAYMGAPDPRLIASTQRLDIRLAGLLKKLCQSRSSPHKSQANSHCLPYPCHAPSLSSQC